MRISSSLLAQQPTELLRFRNAKLRAQTITTHKVGLWKAMIVRCLECPFYRLGDSLAATIG
jgi:hypothetical protein